jgi:hypothetical protein
VHLHARDLKGKGFLSGHHDLLRSFFKAVGRIVNPTGDRRQAAHLSREWVRR